MRKSWSFWKGVLLHFSVRNISKFFEIRNLVVSSVTEFKIWRYDFIDVLEAARAWKLRILYYNFCELVNTIKTKKEAGRVFGFIQFKMIKIGIKNNFRFPSTFRAGSFFQSPVMLKRNAKDLLIFFKLENCFYFLPFSSYFMEKAAGHLKKFIKEPA